MRTRKLLIVTGIISVFLAGCGMNANESPADNPGNEPKIAEKHVPTMDELKQEAGEYPAPDGSFCGTWQGYFEENISGGIVLELKEPDEENVYPIEININRISDASGSGGVGLDLKDARIDAVGRIDDNGLMIVTGDVNEGYMDQDRNQIFSSIKGVLEQYKEGLRFIVLETDCDSAKPGDNFVMTRM